MQIIFLLFSVFFLIDFPLFCKVIFFSFFKKKKGAINPYFTEVYYLPFPLYYLNEFGDEKLLFDLDFKNRSFTFLLLQVIVNF